MFEKIFGRSGSFRNVAALVSGNIVSQLIPLAIAPVNGRIYSPEDYGVLGLFLSITNIISVVSTLRLQVAIVLPEKEADGMRIFLMCLLSALVFAVSTFLFLLGYDFFGGGGDFLDELGWWIWFLPISIFFNAGVSAASVVLIRLRVFGLYSRLMIISAVMVACASVGLGISIDGPAGLITGYLIGNVFMALAMFVAISKRVKFVGKDFFKLRSKLLLFKYRKFPIFSLPTDFLFTLIKQLPVYFIVLISGKRELGMFNMSSRLLGLPIDAIASSFGNVFMQEAAAQYAKTGETTHLFKSTLRRLIILSVIPFLVIALFAPFIFSIVLGEEWYEAGIYSQYLVPMYFLKFVSVPLIFMYSIANRQQEDMLVHIAILLILCGVFVWAWASELSIYLTLLLYGIVYTFAYSFMLFRSYQFAKGKSVSAK